jgi:hypothetical protein
VPPRYAYWTILIDNQPTAFRAKDRDELLPTLNQLKRKSPTAEMKWFARGKLWDSPEQAQWAGRNMPAPARSRDWRPGGEHKDPRARWDKRKRPPKPSGPAPAGEWRPSPKSAARPAPKSEWRPAPKSEWRPAPKGGVRRSQGRPNRPQGAKPWQGKRQGWRNKPPDRNK